MTIACRGAWDMAHIENYLTTTVVPMRLACVGKDEFPRVISLWYRYENGYFYCVTHDTSPLRYLLENDARVGFEIATNEPPYRGVRGQGEVALSSLDDSPTLKLLLERYLGDDQSSLAQWLLSRSEQEMLVTLTPHRFFSWDYSHRMSATS